MLYELDGFFKFPILLIDLKYSKNDEKQIQLHLYLLCTSILKVQTPLYKVLPEDQSYF
jgi:hypothetical protein